MRKRNSKIAEQVAKPVKAKLAASASDRHIYHKKAGYTYKDKHEHGRTRASCFLRRTGTRQRPCNTVGTNKIIKKKKQKPYFTDPQVIYLQNAHIAHSGSALFVA